MSSKESYPPGKLPDDVMELIQHFVSYSKEYREAEQKNLFGPISEFKKQWKDHISKFKKQWKDEFRDTGKLMEMIKSIGTVDSDNQKIWKLFLDSLYDMIDYQNKLNKNIKNNLTRYLSNKIAQYPKHSKIPSLVEWNRKSERDINDIVEMKVEFQLLIAESGKDITATSLKNIWHDSRVKRNCCEHIEQYLNGLIYGLIEEKHIETFVTFFELLDNGIDSQKKDLMDYFSFIGIGEDWGVVSKPAFFTYYTTQVQDRDLLYETRSENVLSILNLREWQDYIPVKCKDQEGEEGLSIDLLLGAFRDRENVVEINGEGGRGKTALVYEFIKRVQLQDQVTLKPFENVIMFTSKSKKQGELVTESFKQSDTGKIEVTNPRDPRTGHGEYINELKFDEFKSRLRKYDNENHDLEDELDLINYLKEKDFLVVIDNFEDVSKENKKAYRKFLNQLNGGKTKVIVTGRPIEIISRFYKINIREMSTEEANRLLLARFEHLMKNYPRVFNGRTKDLEELLDLRSNGRNLLQEIVQGSFGMDTNSQQAKFKECVSHPQNLFYLVSLLGNLEIQKEIKLSDMDGVAEYIVKVAAEPKYGFQEFHDNQLTWSTEKAYDIVTLAMRPIIWSMLR